MLYGDLKIWFSTATLTDNDRFLSTCWIQQIDAYLAKGINKPECVIIKAKLQKLYEDINKLK